MSETLCKYVSSRGILKSCDIHDTSPISSSSLIRNYIPSEIKDGSTIYICTPAIPTFLKIFEQTTSKFILVTGDCDVEAINMFETHQDFFKFLESDNLIHWYAQNMVVLHPKITQIPIGLDYHTLSERDHECGPKMSPTEQELLLPNTEKYRYPKAYANFQFTLSGKYGYDRQDAIDQISKELVFYEPRKLKRTQTWERQSKFTFVISPHGNGLDCHRTWEALTIGCIPIVKSSPIDSLYTDLPVLIVRDWSDITQNLMYETISEFKSTEFNYDKLTLDYWVSKIRSGF